MLIFKTIIYFAWVGVCLFYTYEETGVATTITMATIILMLLALAHQIGEIKQKGMGAFTDSKGKTKNKFQNKKYEKI